MTDEKKLSMLSIEVLSLLLDKLGASNHKGELALAYEQCNDALFDDNIAVWLRHILAEVDLKQVQVAQLGWRRLDQRRLPALVYYQHTWYLAEKDSEDSILLTAGDGSTESCVDDDLQDCQVLWLRIPSRKQSQDLDPSKKNVSLRLILRELFRESGWLKKVLIATLIINILAVATSIFAMQVYDRVVPTLAYATLTTLVAGMVIIIFLEWFLGILRARILDSMSCAVDKRLSQKVFDHLVHIQLDAQPRSLGTLAAQVSGLDAARQFFSSGVIFTLIDMPFALLFLAFIAMIGGNVAWVYALLLPIALLLGWVTQLRLRKLLYQQQVRYNERQGVLVDCIQGAESIRANNAGWRFSQSWQDITESINGYDIQQKAISNFSMLSTGFLSKLTYVAAIVVGVWQIEAGNLTMGGLIACSILGGRIIAPIAQCVQYLTQWQNVSQSLEMVDQVLNIDLERKPGQHLLMPEEMPQSVDLHKVRFAYPESPVRQIDVSTLHVNAGERVLLLGSIGCGKSTLLKILAGLYRPNEGRIRLGDADLWEVDPQVVAKHVGYLPQSVHLFKGTLRSNLALSSVSGDSRLMQITRDLGIDAIAANSSLGMEMPISEGGEGLSGGQRQLVALARVVISQPTIWLLDEPTASLDAESEAMVWKVIEDNLRPQDILIVSTHKPMQAIGLATRVIQMQQGEIIRDGKPEVILPQLASPVQRQSLNKQMPGKLRGAPNVI